MMELSTSWYRTKSRKYGKTECECVAECLCGCECARS